ncbi:MAG: CDP-alcohol phosphatidyltransferase family protein [Spirochaetes bacterium]|nr:CDP-alcohol phosphatidyltransferase family protein [Spirochaetota bacterium]
MKAQRRRPMAKTRAPRPRRKIALRLPKLRLPKNPVRPNKSWIPNFATLTSLFFGFSSILASLQAVKEIIVYLTPETMRAGEPQRYLAYAGIFIIAGVLLDFMDGMLARALGVQSEFGKHLDSMADLVTFGIAPGVLFYVVTLFAGHSLPETGVVYNVAHYVPDWLVNNLFLVKVLSFLFPICAVVRLARFNNLPPQPWFSGVPSTFAGGTVALFLVFSLVNPPVEVLFKQYHVLQNISFFASVAEFFRALFRNFLFLLVTYSALALLMISPIRFYKIKYHLARLPRRGKILVLVAIIVGTGLFFQYALILAAIYYFGHSIVRHFWFLLYPEKEVYE